MSIREVATVLGKSERQVRYMIRGGVLEARKEGKRWRIQSRDLPLTEPQRARLEEQLEAARREVEAAFQPVAKAVAGNNRDKTAEGYSVCNLEAFTVARELYREIGSTFGEDHPAHPILFETLVQLTQGCHVFRRDEKAACFGEARRLAAAATAHLLVGSDSAGEDLAGRLEQHLIPKIGGLVAAQEKRRRKSSRFDRFGSASRRGR